MAHPEHGDAHPHPRAHGHESGHEHEHEHDHATDDGGDDLLDLDGEVLASVWDAALDRAVAALGDRMHGAQGAGADRLRVVDLGAGTGTGALGLARRLPGAEVVAVDVSEASLARLAAKAAAAGVGDRVRTLVVDLDAGRPDLGPVDLTWASMSLHHLGDPGRTLADLRGLTRDGGVVAVSEFDEPVRFLPDDLGVGRPGLESRAMETLSRLHAEELPTMGTDWAQVLTGAGWTVVDRHDVVIDERSPEHPAAGRYVRAWFARLAQGLADRLDAEDLATLEALLDDTGPHALLHRTDLHLRGVRTLTVARA